MPLASSRSSLIAACSSSAAASRRARSSGDDAIAGGRLAGLLEGQAHRHESLLRAVVEVALQPASLVLAGLDEPCSRGSNLLELRLQRRVEPFVLDGQSQHRHDRSDERRVFAKDGSCSMAASGRPSCSSIVTAWLGVLGRFGGVAAIRGQPAIAVRIAPDEPDARVAEGGSQRRLEPDRRRDSAEPDREGDQRPAGHAAAAGIRRGIRSARAGEPRTSTTTRPHPTAPRGPAAGRPVAMK